MGHGEINNGEKGLTGFSSGITPVTLKFIPRSNRRRKLVVGFRVIGTEVSFRTQVFGEAFYEVRGNAFISPVSHTHVHGPD
jgi:hypothetical protein